MDDLGVDGDAERALADALALIERLDADNERLRMKVLEVLRLMEDAVTEGVRHERREAELEQQCANLEAELAALRNTKLLRAVAPLRAAYAKVRRRG